MSTNNSDGNNPGEGTNSDPTATPKGSTPTGAKISEAPPVTFSNPATSASTSGGTFNIATDTANAANAVRTDVAELQKALEEAKSKSEENWNLFVRTRADMDNYRRRSELDVENARKYGIERFARELIAVVDSLEHGLAVAESEHDTVYREGMLLTLKLCLDIFEKFGITRIDPALSETFDPNKHEAISIQATKDVEPNKIMVVAQKGFMLQDRVLRPARVVVSKAAE